MTAHDITTQGGTDLLSSAPDVDAFHRRLANLLCAGRAASGMSHRRLARASGGAFDARQLRQIEAGSMVVDEDAAVELAALYGVDLTTILGERLPIQVTANGELATGGVIEQFDPGDSDSMLTAYLRLVRRLRHQQRAELIDLRRDDVEILAEHLGLPGMSVVERLGSLMGATRARRTSMAALFGAGVAVIGLTTGVAAVASIGGDSPEIPDAPVAAIVVSDNTDGGLEAITVTIPVAEDPGSGVVDGPSTTEVRDAHVSPVIIPSVIEPQSPTVPVVAAAPPATNAPPAPPATSPPATSIPPTTSTVEVGLPPLPPGTSPPPIDSVPADTPVEAEPPPPIVPPDDIG